MSFCPRCKVSLSPDALWCPLCRERSVLSPDSTAPSSESAYTPVSFAADVRDAEERERLTPVEKRLLVFELLTVVYAIIFVVTFGVDLVYHRAVTWSRFTSVCVILLWLYSALPFILVKKLWILFAVLSPSTVLAVFLWGVFTGSLSWFLPLGLPLTLLVEGLVAAAVPLVGLQKHRGLNSIAVILCALAVLCTGIDFFVSLFFSGTPGISWSLVVLLSIVPVSGFFFYLHYRIMNRASLRKLFRL